jgi:hypothetical protein
MELEGSATKRGFVSAECEEWIRRNVKRASVVTSTAAFAARCVFDNTPMTINQVNNKRAIPMFGLFGKHS